MIISCLKILKNIYQFIKIEDEVKSSKIFKERFTSKFSN